MIEQHLVQRALQAGLVVLMLAGCAGAGTAEPKVPAALKAPANQIISLQLAATGVQIYTCGPDKDAPAKLAWNFKAPEAELFDARHVKFGKHYAGPTWEGNDGSKVVGQVRAQDPGPDAGAVAWLLLGAKANSGTGVFSQVLSIQRVDTVGGKAPAGGCAAAQAGQELRVPYTANYVFYVAKAGSSM